MPNPKKGKADAMQQAETKAEVKTETKKVILTSQEQEIRALVERAEEGPPRITDIEDLYRRKEMQIPSELRRPECVYRWLSTDNLGKETVGNRRRWEIVTRSNHSHVPSAWFGDSGAIQHGKDAVLCFQWRDQAERMQRQIEHEFNLSAEKVINPEPKKFAGPGGKERAVVEQVDGKLGASTMEKEMVDEKYYDFGDTGS